MTVSLTCLLNSGQSSSAKTRKIGTKYILCFLYCELQYKNKMCICCGICSATEQNAVLQYLQQQYDVELTQKELAGWLIDWFLIGISH